MLLIDREKLAKHYTLYNRMLKKTYDSLGYKLKYDYNNKKYLNRIEKLASIPISDDYLFAYIDVPYSFIDCLSSVLSNFDNEELMNLFTAMYLDTTIDLDDTMSDIGECRANVSATPDGKFDFTIKIPEDYKNTNILYAALLHEYAHFSTMIKNINSDYYEYSEVLSMFFEYLMYENITPSLGYQFFINNRVTALKETLSDLKDDLLFAKSPSYLEIPFDTYKLPIASALSYSDGFEFVLSLIERMDFDSKEVYKSMSKIALGLSTCEIESKKLDIDTSSYKNIKKLIKK